MADAGATAFVGVGSPGGGTHATDNRAETSHALAPTVFVGGGGRVFPTDNRFEAVVPGGGPAVPDTSPPTIDNFSPPVGTQLGARQSVSFDLKDDQGLKRGVVLVAQPEGTFTAHDGDTFLAPFAGVRVPIVGGFRVTVSRGGSGWTAGPVFRYVVTDNAGNEAI